MAQLYAHKVKLNCKPIKLNKNLSKVYNDVRDILGIDRLTAWFYNPLTNENYKILDEEIEKLTSKNNNFFISCKVKTDEKYYLIYVFKFEGIYENDNTFNFYTMHIHEGLGCPLNALIYLPGRYWDSDYKVRSNLKDRGIMDLLEEMIDL